jgi:hypothetical protein
MSDGPQENRSIVRREQADQYLLLSLVAFAVTVIFTRAYLHLTGFPQIGNSVLHIAHALWGGLLQFVAVLLPLILANRWAITASAVLGGVGIGLFIDEVGKFITQANDYFFAPALSIIYAFFLLTVFAYFYFRRPQKLDPRSALYRVFDRLQDVLDGNLDAEEAARIEAQLAIAKQSSREEVVSLATVLGAYVTAQREHLPQAEPGFSKRLATRIDGWGRRIGRRAHRIAISILLIGWVALVAGYIAILVRGGANLDQQVLQWRGVLVVIQAVIGCLMLVAAFAWFSRNEDLGVKLSVSGLLLSLVALQMHYFYISQFYAVTATLIQFGLLQIPLAYRRWYLTG